LSTHITIQRLILCPTIPLNLGYESEMKWRRSLIPQIFRRSIRTICICFFLKSLCLFTYSRGPLHNYRLLSFFFSPLTLTLILNVYIHLLTEFTDGTRQRCGYTLQFSIKSCRFHLSLLGGVHFACQAKYSGTLAARLKRTKEFIGAVRPLLSLLSVVINNTKYQFQGLK
jgi:hypothetical protein